MELGREELQGKDMVVRSIRGQNSPSLDKQNSIVDLDLREVKVCDDEEEERARDKHVVVVLADVCECAGARFGD